MRIVISIFVVVFCFFSSCQKKGNNLLTLRLNTPGEPPTLDSRKCSDSVSAAIIPIFSDGLTRIGVDKTVELSLAESYTLSEDQKTYTFTLRDAKWSDGTTITAYEFEETWKEILKPEFPAFGAFNFYKIKNARLAKEGKVSVDQVGVKALDAKTFQVELEKPMDCFLELIAACAFYPYPQRIADNNLAYIENKSLPFICCGPFDINKWKSQHHMLFTKNQGYWDKESVKLDQIKMSFVLDQSTELSMYEQGDLDWCGQPISVIPIDSLNVVKKRDDYHTYKMSGVYFYLFNTEEFPLNNANIRKALTLSINRKNLIEHVIQVDHEVATSFIPKIVKSLNKNFFADADILKAREYFRKGLEELGLTRQEFPKLEISFNTEPNMHFKVAQAIQQQWKKTLGIETRLRNTEWKVYIDELTHGKFQIARMGTSSAFTDAGFFIEQFVYKNVGFNFSGWYSKNYSDLYNSSQDCLNAEERLAVLNEAETVFMDEMPIAPIYFYTNSYLKRPYVKGIVLPHSGGIDYKWAYIESNKGSK